jgi:hypothetical protein
MDTKSESLDELEIIAALLHDVHDVNGLVFNTRALKLTIKKVSSRYSKEGISFLTKTLPRLGKAFDKALSEASPLNATELGFKPQPWSKLPILFGEFFCRVLHTDGTPLPYPCIESVKVIRQICYLFYKYELPFTDEQEQKVVEQFEKTEDDLKAHAPILEHLFKDLGVTNQARRARFASTTMPQIAREARILLSGVFSGFDCLDIYPQHGPGTVATKQQLQEKYMWTNVSARITECYPFDAYFCASQGHVCDSYQSFSKVGNQDHSARVILVPKDSRGPRLISCEPVDFQWIQQGLRKAMCQRVESHRLTKGNVFFTDQSPNQIGSLYGSLNGRYATLDLKEASDRVSVDLVRLLFPEYLCRYLESCRSLSTVLPDGRVLPLRKFAPMGSALCFPIMALTIWAILTAVAPDQYTRERILVYGDDVVVPQQFVVTATSALEAFGLRVNLDKCCTKGFFRESCGVDAFHGINVTPVRFRTVWSTIPSPEVYSSWIAYANSMFDRKRYRVYNLIVERLVRIYGTIPHSDMNLSCPSLRQPSEDSVPIRRRWNKNLQKFEFRIRDVVSPPLTKVIDGWSMLLRYFAEGGPTYQEPLEASRAFQRSFRDPRAPFSVSSYTRRHSSILAWRWR